MNPAPQELLGLPATPGAGNRSNRPRFRLDYINTACEADGWKLNVYFSESTVVDQEERQAFLEGIRPEQIGFLRSSGIPATFFRIEAMHPDRGNLVLQIAATHAKHAIPNQAAQYRLGFHQVEGLEPAFTQAPFYLGTVSGSDPRLLTKNTPSSPSDLAPSVEISYMAKDYDSFRRTILEHMTLFLPQWTERHPADLGIVLVELLAYAADSLSYYQDSVSTEAYLETARQRVSIRRHVRLLDYRLSEGCDGRVWVHIPVNDDAVPLPKGTPLITGMSGKPVRIPLELYPAVLSRYPDAMVFEAIYDTFLYEVHNLMTLYTGGAKQFILPQGATGTDLSGHFPMLAQGNVLLFERFRTDEADPDTQDLPQAHIVRLNANPLLTSDPATGDPVTRITWYEADALPVDLPVTGLSSNGTRLYNRYIVRGNMFLADGGRTISKEALSKIPAAGSYEPRLKHGRLVYGVPFIQEKARYQSAASATVQRPEDALPAIRLEETLTNHSLITLNEGFQVWRSQNDLLSSGPFSPDFVVECQEDGIASLRFGDGALGKKPGIHANFNATYRVRSGNDTIGSDTLGHIVTDDKRILGIRNPQGSVGFSEQETLAHARLNAPQTFQAQKRCITLADHIQAAETFPDVKTAAAELVWTGSWETVFIYVQRWNGRPTDAGFSARLLDFLDTMRLAGRDIQIRPPCYVPLDITLEIHLTSTARRNQVHALLRAALGNHSQPADAQGFFAPDHFSFGQPVYQSQIIATCSRIPGVAQVAVTRFRRYGRPRFPNTDVTPIPVGPLEIVRLDNNPSQPEWGRLFLNLIGGRNG